MSVIESILKRSTIRQNGPQFGDDSCSQCDLLVTKCSWRQKKPSAIGCDGECAVEVSILASATHQIVVRALFLDDTSIQHNDAVNPFERRDPMRNENDRLMGKVPGQIHKNLSFGGCIEG